MTDGSPSPCPSRGDREHQPVRKRLRLRLPTLTALAVALSLIAIASAPASPTAPSTSQPAAAAPVTAPNPILKKIVWGLDDQHIALFADPRWHALPLREVRYFVPWDVMHEPHYLHLADKWLTIAGETGAIPLIAITQSDIKGQSRKLPSVAKYKSEVGWLMHRWPWIRQWTPWNEANLLDQATLQHPARAAAYWRAAKNLCPRCVVTSPSLVGYRDASAKWMTAFLRAARGLHGPWAIHVYNDINEFNTYALSKLERQLPAGPIWVTEVGGWLRFVGYPLNFARQARADQYLFQVAAATYPRITRWYLYQWFASAPGDRWDSGLINVNGSARPALKVVQQQLLG